ncbi:MAG: F0F1 ATP synthase subunit B [Gemmatimonadetes bacterium]|nr:F0F1 ATP synthase subunit B [Gemmatimonadota bacterium]MDE2728866.1 F0F1 ATP synthase subunit B [Gemmatimonadota bacterium]MXX03024.1 F0F1 ATP synthase subunit B [Gemmatimonadota bacterium]MXY98057.1 F0F1 ATP synthase subunit B [Gemmatimonadota bacterium]MYD26701.1 F0F1 ATP synthase subunit B [Gemmatimonadota bacterium]
MLDILHDLGIDLSTLIIQMIGFAVLFFVLRKYVFGIIAQAIEDRKRDIRDRMEGLDADRAELDRLHEEARRRLEDIETEAREKMQAAVDQANAERGRILEHTQQEAERELEKARNTIRREKESAVAELRAQVGDLAVEIAGRILNSTLDATEHRKVVDEFIAQMPSKE